MRKPRRLRSRHVAAFAYSVECDRNGDIVVFMSQGKTKVRFCVEADDAYAFASDILRKYDQAVGIA